MKMLMILRLGVLLMTFGVTGVAPFFSEAQEKKAVGRTYPDESKDKVEAPIKSGVAPAPEKYDLAKTGIEWHKGLDAALNKGKPILLFQLLGQFDEVYC